MKQLLYQLIFYDNELSYEDYRQEFCIGIFSSFDRAQRAAEYYSGYVEGFKDYDCSYNILEKELLGDELCGSVYIIWGWNENENFDEVHIIESDCFVQEETAREKMAELQKNYSRTNWCIDRFVLNECLWKDGFVRV